MSTKSAFAILLGMVIILAINPRMIYSIYDNILGRLCLICIVLFLSMKNTTLGLLATLVIIISLNQFSTFVEGMENGSDTSDPATTNEPATTDNTGQTIGDDNVPNTGRVRVLTKTTVTSGTIGNNQTISQLKEKAASIGVDREDIRNAIAAKSEKAFPQPTSGSTENTMPSTEGMLNKYIANKETFSTLR